MVQKNLTRTNSQQLRVEALQNVTITHLITSRAEIRKPANGHVNPGVTTYSL